MINMWSINRVLRWTGFRLVVDWAPRTEQGIFTIGFVWYGWGFVNRGEDIYNTPEHMIAGYRPEE